MLPPRIVRRLIFAPLAILITVAALVLSPLLLVVALVTAPSRTGRRRALRLMSFGLSWLVMESIALVACLGLWIVSGFGGRLRTEASMDRHYGLVRWFLATLFRRALKVFRLRVEISEPPATADELAARLTRPVIVLSRHAGPGDSFLLVHHLLSLYGRKPRIVMKASLQFDPSLDVVINRLPHAFVLPRQREAAAEVVQSAGAPAGEAPSGEASSGEAFSGELPLAEADPAGLSSVGAAGGGTDRDSRLAARAGQADQVAVEAAAGEGPASVTDEIRRLAAGLGPTGALVIFPEGGNFTPSRRRRGIRQLERARRYEQARRARGMANLLPPRSGGAFAAIDAAPTADVVFVAHTGLDDLITVGDVWRGLPMEQVIRAQWWRVPAADVPRDREAVVAWLYDWWERIDGWIDENRPPRPSTEVDKAALPVQ